MKLDGIDGITIATISELKIRLENLILEAVKDNPDASVSDITMRFQTAISTFVNHYTIGIEGYVKQVKERQKPANGGLAGF